MSDHHAPARPVAPDDPRVLALIHRMVETEAELRALLGEYVDLVLDPTTGTPLFFRETQQALLRTQDELRQANAQLEQRVEARTAELRESEERLSAILEQLPVGVGVSDTEGHFFISNAIMRGYVHQQMPSRDPALVQRWHAVDAEGRPLPPEQWPGARALRGESVRPGMELIYTDDTGEHWTLVSAEPYRSVDGEILGVIAVAQDITERKQAEEERERLLREVQTRAAELDTTLSAIADGLLIYDTGGRVVRANAAADRILRYTPEERDLAIPERITALRVEKPDGARFTPEETPAFRALQGEVVSGAIMVVHRPHGVIWTSVSAAPLQTEEGAIFGAVVVFTDITPLHNLQEQMRTMLQIVSHDLRAPITVLHGHVGLLRDALKQHHLGGPIRESIEAIARSEQRMNRMIEDLVDVTRFEGGQLQLERQAVSLADFLQDLCTRLETAMAMERVVIDVPIDLPPVYADYNRLDRIVTNLLSNALKYSEGPVRITASPEDDEVVISVADQGQGIDPVDLPHIFERFYRTTGKRKAEGIGLGLYITRMLVEAHGGRIWVDSEFGQGSTFHFTLPRA
jgi:signal transduction histidine kinase